ncbi:MAG TPA: RdgB/HAM1 family non-canonical purine NTP pyrophosphatase [Steroidobacteraceae bacterium]|nr:RdgB/HAM1 family non-canonical purine NTP pyrophosphatase [Steroidobacteraceae bacterium]
MRVVLATGNRGKLREFAALLAPLGIALERQSAFGIDPVEETGRTFAENALLKARHAAGASGLPALADDSGLEVQALGGRPGVYSARFAGPDASDADNVRKLLEEMRGVEARAARFRCVLAFVRTADDAAPLICEGAWAGHIAQAPAGEQGFGYDPVFAVPGLGLTAAQLAPERKNALSHRAQALARLVAALATDRGALQSPGEPP